MQKLSEDTARTLHMAETSKQPFLIINVAVSPALPMALQITVPQTTPPPPPRVKSRLIRCDPPMHAFYCEVNQSRMCSSSIISQAQKLSPVSSYRLLCINSLYYYATILLSLIECGKHIILSAECKCVSAIASDDNIKYIFRV